MDSQNQKQSFPTGIERRADAAINGLLSHLPAGVTQLTVAGVTYQIPDLVKHAQELVKPWKDTRAARSVIREASQNRPVDDPKLRLFLAALKDSVSTVVGRESEELRNFGMTPARRRRDLTTEEKAARAEKARLTRELRHTMGSRQKAALRAGEPEPGPKPANPGSGPDATPRVA